MSGIPMAERRFIDAAVRRIGLLILLLTPAGAGVVAWFWGGRGAVAFGLGGLLAYGNYRWIVAVVDALVSASRGRVPRFAYVKLLLPLALLVALLYAIFSRSLLPVAGVVAGLFLLVVAVLLEAVYQIARGMRG